MIVPNQRLRQFIVFCLMLLASAIICLSSAIAKEQRDIIAVVYENLNRDYINTIDNKQIALKGLKALETIDSNIKISPASSKVFLYYGKRMVKSFEYPAKNANAAKWVEFNHAVINAAVKISPRAEVLDFELPDRFAASVFKDLDGYSHYYGQFSEDENNPTFRSQNAPNKAAVITRRNFASRLIDDILLIKIFTFQKGISQKVLNAVNDCSTCKGIILDMRGNHGGIFDEAIKIADLFLDEGIISYTAGRVSEQPRFYTASEGDISENKPIVILVDGFTASAAEVIAAALSEQNRAILIGTETYGKGTVQDIMKLHDGSAMALTTAYFYTPSGFKIDKVGLKPAICTGGIKDENELQNANCDRADRFNEDVDVAIAVRYLKNEM